MTIPYHPLAELFPLMEGAAFEELVADIKAHGLHNPITLYETKIIDGRNRERACEEAGVEPFYDSYDGNDPLRFVVSQNVARRHLDDSQRAMIAARVENMPPHRPAGNSRRTRGGRGPLGGDARDSMENASTWADYIRLTRPETAPWHYVNIKITASGYNAATDCPPDDCVVAQVQKDARIVADHQLAKPVRAEALRFLIHFVGDVHQPLHCADNHDRGGNEVGVLIGAEQTNLHTIWDTDVVAALGQDPAQTASALEAQITPADEASWGRGSPADWANESFGVAKRTIYASLRGEGGTEAPIILSRDYAARMRPVSATQLERAGVRLALLLNEALAHPLAEDTQPARASLDRKPQAVASVTAGPITPEAAASHVGENATIKGVVVEVYKSRSGVTFLDMGARYPDNPFAAVIFPEDAGKFPDVGSLSGKVVEVAGAVRLYKGKPEIILRTADQLKAE